MTEACFLIGVSIDDLVKKPESDFGGPDVPQEIRKMRYKAYLARHESK